jgi:hypothetical protein
MKFFKIAQFFFAAIDIEHGGGRDTATYRDPFVDRELRPVSLRHQPGCDHSYYFISKFRPDHVSHYFRKIGNPCTADPCCLAGLLSISVFVPGRNHPGVSGCPESAR